MGLAPFFWHLCPPQSLLRLSLPIVPCPFYPSIFTRLYYLYDLSWFSLASCLSLDVLDLLVSFFLPLSLCPAFLGICPHFLVFHHILFIRVGPNVLFVPHFALAFLCSKPFSSSASFPPIPLLFAYSFKLTFILSRCLLSRPEPRCALFGANPPSTRFLLPSLSSPRSPRALNRFLYFYYFHCSYYYSKSAEYRHLAP